MNLKTCLVIRKTCLLLSALSMAPSPQSLLFSPQPCYILIFSAVSSISILLFLYSPSTSSDLLSSSLSLLICPAPHLYNASILFFFAYLIHHSQFFVPFQENRSHGIPSILFSRVHTSSNINSDYKLNKKLKQRCLHVFPLRLVIELNIYYMLLAPQVHCEFKTIILRSKITLKFVQINPVNILSSVLALTIKCSSPGLQLILLQLKGMYS